MEMFRGRPKPLSIPLNKQYRLHITSNRPLLARMRATSDPDKLQIVFISTEVAPWSKVGGLADVIYALPAALAARGHDVMSVSPQYQPHPHLEYTGIDIPLQLPALASPSTTTRHDDAGDEDDVGGEDGTGGEDDDGDVVQQIHYKRRGRRRKQGKHHQRRDGCEDQQEGNTLSDFIDDGTTRVPHHARLYTTYHRGVRRVFVDHPLLRTNDIYGGGSGASLTYAHSEQHSDLDLRYNILCQASLAAAAMLFDGESTAEQQKTMDKLVFESTAEQQKTMDKLVFVANDWPTALHVLRLRYMYRTSSAIPTVRYGNNRTQGDNDFDSLHRLLQQRLARAVTAFCIHNLAYQGIFPSSSFSRMCLPRAAKNAMSTTKDWREELLSLSLPLSYQESKEENCMNERVEHAADDVYSSSESLSQVLHQQHITGNGALLVHNKVGEGVIASGGMSAMSATALLMTKQQPAIDKKGTLATCQCSNHKEYCCQCAAQKNAAPMITNNSRDNNHVDEDEGGGDLNWMRGSLIASDRIITVSPTYAKEIQSMDSMMGCGMQELLSLRGVTGIMNGIDTEEWNPSTDEHLPTAGRFSHHSFIFGKAYMKAQLQERLKLDHRPDAALVVFIGRLTDQKGVDVVLSSLPALIKGPPPPLPYRIGSDPSALEMAKGSKLQIAMLGTGDPSMQAALDCLCKSFPGRAVGVSSFSEELAHWMLAAADYVIVPSRFEPCGLVAQCGCRYGAVPIVTPVGGLRDLVLGNVNGTITSKDDGDDTSAITSSGGISLSDIGIAMPPLSDPGDADGRRWDVYRMIKALHVAEELCGGVKHRHLQRTCMTMDVSWDKPAEEWERVLSEMVCADTNGE